MKERSATKAPAQDRALIEGCLRGEAVAFETLVARFEKPLVNFCFRCTGDREAAEDLFQETMVRVLRSLERYTPRCALSTWIYTIARNLCLDLHRRRRRARSVSLSGVASSNGARVIHLEEVLAHGGADPVAEASRRELGRRVRDGLDRLGFAHREALVLRFYQRLPYTELAQVLGVPVGTAKYRVHEAVKALGRLLQERAGDARRPSSRKESV